MKNFFKKLSFVLAVAMVLTSLAPATASAASKNYVNVKGQKPASYVNAYIGGQARNLDYNINGKTSKVDGKWSTSNKKIADVDQYGIIKPIKNGTVTVTFTPADKKQAAASMKVKVRTRAKSMNMYDAAEYAAGTKTKLQGETITMKVGDSKELLLTMPMYSASVKAGAKKATYYTYVNNTDDAKVGVEVSANADNFYDEQRMFTLTAKTAGEATITFNANQTKPENVKNEYMVSAEITVKVEDNLAAKQTGATKITVSGSDLTDDIKDYVVKRGNVAVSMSDKVELNDAKTEAVLTASASVMPAGDYTLSFKESDAVEFPVELSRIENIEIVGDTLALTDEIGKTNTATVSYQVLNQFGEDITAKTTNMSATTSFGTAVAANGVVTVTGVQNAIIGSTGTMVVVNTATGKNVTKTLTLGRMGQAASFEVKGVYGVDGKEATIVEAGDLAGAALLVLPRDQYGNALAELNVTTDVAVTCSAGLTNLALAPATNGVYKETMVVDGVKYVKLPLALVKDATGVKAGEATVFFVSKTTGNNISATITVEATTTVKTIDVYPKDTVYLGEDAEFEYVALTEDGTEVKKHSILKSETYGVKLPERFRWEKNLDGTAKLVYNSEDGKTPLTISAGVASITDAATFVTAGYGVKTLTFSVYAATKPVAIGGVKDVKLGRLSDAKDADVVLTAKNLVVYDQYGRTVDFTDAKGNGYTVTVVKADGTKVGSINLQATEGQSITLKMPANVDTVTKTSYRLALNDGKDDIAGSDITITTTVAPMSAVKTFTLKEIPTMHITNDSKYNQAPVVTGKLADGTEIAIDADKLTLTGDLVNKDTDKAFTASNVALAEGTHSKEVQAVVTVDNAKGDQLTQTVTVSDADPVATTVKWDANAKLTNGTNAVASVLNALVEEVKDQYGVVLGSKLDRTAHISTILISDIDTDVKNVGVKKNNTKEAEIDGTLVEGNVFTLTITLKSGEVITKAFMVEK